MLKYTENDIYYSKEYKEYYIIIGSYRCYVPKHLDPKQLIDKLNKLTPLWKSSRTVFKFTGCESN